MTVFTLVVILGPSPWYTPQYAIPLLGMLLGNTMTGVALGLDRLTQTLWAQRGVVEARLMLGDVYFDREDFLTARAEYQRFIDRYAGHPRSPDAALGVCRALAALAPQPQRDQTYTNEAITNCRNGSRSSSGTPRSSPITLTGIGKARAATRSPPPASA